MRSVDEIKADIARIEAEAPDCCMCGSPMDHSPWHGHTPVSQADYYTGSLREELRAAQARETQHAQR